MILIGYGYIPEHHLNVDNFSCKHNDIQNIPVIKHVDEQLESLWRQLDNDVKEAKRGVISDRYDTNVQEYKTMAFIVAGTLATTHSLVSNNEYMK